MYLPLRHNKVAKVIYQNIIWKNENKLKSPPIVDKYSDDEKEIWWDTKIKTIPPLKHNKPDITYWDKKEKKSYIIDIAVGLDINIKKNINLKYDNYMRLSAELKKLYPEFNFEIIPLVIGATGLVTDDLMKNIKKLGIENTKKTITKCQEMALLGTVKIVKSFMKMKTK